MKRLRIYFINYFGFSKVEANASIILVIVIVVFAIVPRFLIHNYQSNLTTLDSIKQSSELLEWHHEVKTSLRLKEKKIDEMSNMRFEFDPNLASVKDLISLGFKPYAAERIERYRNAGGIFREATDLNKVYGVNTKLVAELLDYINIPPFNPPKVDISELSLPPTIAEIEEEKEDEKPIKIDLNLATAQDLENIKGIGPYYAAKITKYRDALGGFSSLRQIGEIYKIRPEIVKAITSNTFIEVENIKSIPVNSDSIKHIARHPYISWNQARAIFNYRQQHGQYINSTDLKEIKIISDSLYQKISPYLSVEP